MDHYPWVSVVTFAPLAGAIVLSLVPRSQADVAKWWALLVTLATFGLSLGLLAMYDGGQAGYQLIDRTPWVRSLGFEYLLGVDGISVFLVLLTTFLFPLAVLASWRGVRNPKLYFGSFLVLETAVVGSFVALDLLLFFVFFEALLLPMYMIIGGWGGERRAYAAVKFFIFTMAGSAFLLVAILFLYFRAGSQLGQPTFDVTQLAGLSLPVTTARWLWLGFFVAFAVKVPLVPLSTWQPDAYAEAPTAGTLVLAALLAKVGAYGLIRFNLSLFPDASVHFRDLALTLAVVAILYGAVAATVQTDIKRLIAYSSLSHMGFIVLGIFAFTVTAASGSVLYMVNHGLSTGALFLLVGMLGERIGTNDLRRMGGLGARVPILAGVFLFMALASVGLPGLNNFVSEFLVLLGTFASSQPYAVAAAVALVLAAIYLLWAYQRAFHGVPAVAGGAPDEADVSGNGHVGGTADRRLGMRDLHGVEYAVLVPLIVAVLWLGVYPKPLLSWIEPATTRTVGCVEAVSAPLPAAALPHAALCAGAQGGGP
jgi:NADH-quinone oxidoreductase subunit M